MVSADRAYYDSIQAASGPDAASISFPAYCPQRRFPLAAPRSGIGSTAPRAASRRRSTWPSAGRPGHIRLHAVLLRAADGSWAIVDPGSANGTLSTAPSSPAGQIVPVRDGDRIHLGAWTELRIIGEA